MELHASYKITMWFVNNAQRMLELVNTIVDSAADIVAHNLAGASAKVENAMAKVIPIAIGFLAGVIGIGNLSKKVGDIIDRVKVPITKAIDWVVEKAEHYAKKFLNKILGKDKPVVNSTEKQAKIDAGLAELHKEEKEQATEHNLTQEQAENIAKKVKQKHTVFTSMGVVDGGERWEYEYTASPKQKEVSNEKKAINPTETKIVYSKNRVEANPLTSNRPEGSGTTIIDGWDHAQLLNKEADIWVRGHMLSELLGGTGGAKNLTIIEKTVNSRMSEGPEKTAKDKTAEGKTLSYIVTWENHQSDGPAKHFGKKVKILMHEITDSGLKELPWPTYESSFPSEDLGNVKINLNAIGRPTLMTQFGLSEAIARDIIDARNKYGKFSDSFDISEKVTILYESLNISDTSSKWNGLEQAIKIINIKLKSGNLYIL